MEHVEVDADCDREEREQDQTSAAPVHLYVMLLTGTGSGAPGPANVGWPCLFRGGVRQGDKCTKSASMNVQQCKMARAALGWSLDDLAEASGVGRRTCAKFEAGGSVLPDKVEAMRLALVGQGVAFTNGGKRVAVSALRRD
jgi:DNA-binding XRE family transcriptional regulator